MYQLLFNDLERSCVANDLAQRHEDNHEKFLFVKDAGRGAGPRGANQCWRSIMKVVKAANISIEVGFLLAGSADRRVFRS
jgi:hypothetical protein